ncbi:MAG: polysaccharide deacetylase family protein [Nanoarchaeota archaeon]
MPNLTIVMYHYVRDLKHSRYPEIKGLDINLFKEQLQYIRTYYNVIKMRDVFESLKRNYTLPKNSLLLTFDDAYKDHFEFVFPVLDALGIQGSFFPPGKAISEHRVLDVNKIHFILASVENKEPVIKDLYSLLDTYRNEYNLDQNEDYFNKLAIANRFDTSEIVFIKRMLQKILPEKLRNIILNNLFSKYVSKDEEAFSRELYMNIDQLKCMLRHGMYIGSHGWNHYWLDTLSRDQQEQEIKLSLNFLQNVGCDTSEWAMCYPYGATNDSLISLLKRYNCKLALSTEVGLVNSANDDPFTYKRLDTNDLPKDKDAESNEWTLQIIKTS